ncbi:hypothetical protein [Curtobacterium sp. UNCCL17]|uniref:hypothetical protein n=1 Tax=Curtobacterium sp. UNCCL17 TaxID=1449051 RepID=UPI0012DCD339|nr:hypothetical protein [Curtobacterium sp. UNCCL17]
MNPTKILRSPRGLALVIAAVGAIVAISLGIGWASSASQASAEIPALKDRLQDADRKISNYQDGEQTTRDAEDAADAADAEREQWQDKQDELRDKIDAVDEQQKTLDARQQKVEASELVDGVHIVGTDTAPGVYSLTDSSDCYYVWKTGTGSDADIVDNNIVSGPVTVTLKAGEVFETNGCGAWTKVG